MPIRLFDSATRELRDLDPVVPGHVGIYHCGLTVQGPPHIGHIRKEVVFDVLRRWLTRSGLDVTIVANVTDIDDKVLAKGEEQGRPWYAVAYENERALHAAYDVLGCLPPTYEPRATGHVPEMIEMIGELVERGHAYPADDGSGDVYFDVRSWKAYGELSNQRIDDMQPAEDAPPDGKRDPRDFALWKGHKEGEPETASWPTPWGRGRPGWHIECSVMAEDAFGPVFEIHGGGLDLVFPHHENELAQSTAVGDGFARYWMHNGLLTMAGEKMSKSLGNTLQVREIVKQWRPVEVRYYLGSAHYRSVMEFSPAALDEAAAAYRRIENFVEKAAAVVEAVAGEVPDAFGRALDDDLGVPAALGVLHETVRAGNTALADGAKETVREALAQVLAMTQVLGIDPREWTTSSDLTPVLDGLVQVALAQRAAARERKDYAAADAIRDQLSAAGVVVEDTPDGPRWTLADGR